jgi:hypothetical protein
VNSWPSFNDPRLADRLSIGNVAFNDLALKLAARVPRRDFSQTDLDRALGYPWQRPTESFRLERGVATPLDAVPSIDSTSGQIPLLAFGSNSSPKVIADRLATTGGTVHLLAGSLHDYEVVPSAHLAVYGSLPSTIVRSRGASEEAGLLLVNEAQLELLARYELNYRLAALPGLSFNSDIGWRTPRRIFAFVSRHGAFAPEGQSPPTQAEALSKASPIALGEGGDPEALVRRTLEDYSWAVQVAKPRLVAHSEPLIEDDWELFSSRREGRTG